MPKKAYEQPRLVKNPGKVTLKDILELTDISEIDIVTTVSALKNIANCLQDNADWEAMTKVELTLSHLMGLIRFYQASEGKL